MSVLLQNRDFYSEFEFITSRSGGAGGQHVNKVSSKVELRFQVDKSSLLSDEEKEIVKQKLSNKINNEGYLQIVSQVERSQLLNKALVIKKFYQFLEKALTPVKRRRATKPTKASVQARINEKKKISGKKTDRSKKDFLDDV
jgi:ribosome-associated protein